jgi:hypothetical protein
MAEKELLDEFSKTLSDAHKKYIQSYISSKEKGLSATFDEFLRKELNET